MTSSNRISGGMWDVLTRVVTGLILAALVGAWATLLTLREDVAVIKSESRQAVAVQVRYGQLVSEQTERLAALTLKVSVIEANRFTSADGAALREACRADVEAVRDRLDALSGRIPPNIPPAWFEAFVFRIEERLKILEAK